MSAKKPPSHPRTSDSKLNDSSKADQGSEIEPRRDLLREAWLAASACTRFIPSPYPGSTGSAQEHSRALVFLPVAGLIIGIVLALCDQALSRALPPLPGSAIIIALAVLLSGGVFARAFARTIGTLIGHGPSDQVGAIGWAAAMAMLAAEIGALGAIATPPARARALVLAMLLSRWAIVPIGYGLKPLEKQGLGIPYLGRIRFSEFALSSVIALGIAMGLYDVVGLAAIVAIALTILSLRLLLSRRLGGVGGNELAAGAALCELITLAALAGISLL